MRKVLLYICRGVETNFKAKGHGHLSRKASAKPSRLFARLGTQHSTDVLFDELLFYGMLCSLINELQLHMRTLDNFAFDQTSLDKKQSSRFHSTRWPNALDISLNMHVERCIVKSRERLAEALSPGQTLSTFHYTMLDMHVESGADPDRIMTFAYF